MTSNSRRNFVRSLASVPLALWVSRFASAADPLVRYDCRSTKGQEMLRIYADTVRKMQALRENDPRGWVWQWYTHFAGNTPKANEINRIFGSSPSAMRSLADEMWNTCQSHAGQDPNHFLPWHRMYVLYFESIIRELSGRADFTLPYWNYTTDGGAAGIVPVQFRRSTDPVWNVLYRSDRSANANAGRAIQGTNTSQMDVTNLMRLTSYSNVGSASGFCRTIDSQIHGFIHVLVGNANNMGAVPFAARDPLFWVHHCNIDRLWASWNRAGRSNPTAAWGEREFVFADGKGQRITGRLKNFFDTNSLGYVYENYVSVPAARAADLAMVASGRASASVRVAQADHHASLSNGAAEVELTPLVTSKTAAMVEETTRAAREGKRTYLVLKDLHTRAQPETLYNVYLQLPKGEVAGKSTVNLVGTIHFFDAQFHDHGNGHKADVVGENFHSFDVTELLAKLGREKALDGRALKVTIAATGVPVAGADPMVGTIALVRQ
ncbi:tyrosinase family protein [Tahibacter amnicola]|uniref:Tyrosinase family protein n=1 Tax=Tahibacter amnicola TaxID=2976241 RepID=A0ABY6BE40_9GAMM|nr:tyrosinase family protein [Tahibacter amnicola]UXI68057.1 tyrosinase family protein [Tahibacter amnicola]